MNNLMIEIGMAMIAVFVVVVTMCLVLIAIYVLYTQTIEAYRRRCRLELFVLLIGWWIIIGVSLLIIGGLL
jgi:hypothetical protein